MKCEHSCENFKKIITRSKHNIRQPFKKDLQNENEIRKSDTCYHLPNIELEATGLNLQT